MLEITNLCAGYGHGPVVQGVNIQIARGETIALLGPNGAGKSTLLAALSGTLRERSGRVMMDGADCKQRRDRRAVRTGHAVRKDHDVDTSGDGTARSSVFDVLRRKDWPAPYDFRAIRNALHRKWEGRLDAANAEDARAEYDAGVKAGDFARAHATVGEAAGLIHDLPPAADVIGRMTAGASAILETTRS